MLTSDRSTRRLLGLRARDPLSREGPVAAPGGQISSTAPSIARPSRVRVRSPTFIQDPVRQDFLVNDIDGRWRTVVNDARLRLQAGVRLPDCLSDKRSSIAFGITIIITKPKLMERLQPGPARLFRLVPDNGPDG
jgi:hypothetical protein